MNDQNQNVQPNYDFIVNQNVPGPSKKRSKKPLAIIGLVVFVFIALIGAAVLFAKKTTNNVQPTLANTDKAAQFLTYVADSNSDAAYNMYQDPKPSQDFFKQSFVEPFSKLYDLKSCSLQTDQSQATDTESQLVYKCPVADKSKTDSVNLLVVINKQSAMVSKTEIKT